MNHIFRLRSDIFLSVTSDWLALFLLLRTGWLAGRELSLWLSGLAEDEADEDTREGDGLVWKFGVEELLADKLVMQLLESIRTGGSGK